MPGATTPGLAAVINPKVAALGKICVEDPPRKLQISSYSGPIRIFDTRKFLCMGDSLAKDRVALDLPPGN